MVFVIVIAQNNNKLINIKYPFACIGLCTYLYLINRLQTFKKYLLLLSKFIYSEIVVFCKNKMLNTNNLEHKTSYYS